MHLPFFPGRTGCGNQRVRANPSTRIWVLVVVLLLLTQVLSTPPTPASDKKGAPTPDSQPGYVIGQVIDQATGQPLADATVRLVREAGSAVPSAMVTRTDQRGRYRLLSAAGAVALDVGKEGYVSAYRENNVRAAAVAQSLDARLTPISSLTPYNPLVGATLSLQDHAVTVEIPPATFTGEFGLSLTGLGLEALPAPLPIGWAPVSVVHIGPDDKTPKTPLSLVFQEMSGRQLVGARWNPERHTWMRLEAKLLTDDKGYGIRLALMGTIALVRPDTHPAKPPMPEVGQPLSGVEARPLPKGVVAELVPSPGALFMQPGVRSEIRVGLKDTEAFSSGTRVEAEIREIHQRRDDGLLSPEPRIFDVILFQEKTGLVGCFALGPSVRFEPALLENGAISIDVYAPDALDTSAVVSVEGGSLQTREGLSLEIPPRALTQAMPVTIRPIRPDSVLQGDPRFTVLAGFSLDFAGTVLNTPARAVLKLGEALPPKAQVLVVRPILVHDLTHYELVGIAVNNGRTLVIPADETGRQALDGIRQEGRYYLIRMVEPVGYLSGSVRSKGGPAPEALVSTEQLPFVDLVTAGDSRYILAACGSRIAVHRPGSPARRGSCA